ncbi:MAG: tRNA (adenosine(37)-N6)-threonylcarbamoyltransferase complex ATPase subunit type 1 TsaE [Vulcanococcus sp.]
MDSQGVFLADAAATTELGRRLAERWLALPAAAPAAPRPPLLLAGDLGAGKTCLVQGIAAALGIDEPVTSPTFALAQHYGGPRGALVHLDLYRLELPAAADELFAQEEEEALALGALLAVEWPSRLSFEPDGAWRLELALADGSNPDAGRLAQLRTSS